MKYSFFFIVTFLLTLASCNVSNKNKIIYFGGQIKNPKDNIVSLYKGREKVAITSLNQKHNFMFELDSLDSGLYRFLHGEEYQYIYLEKKDSLLIRLNTWDFDGSLVFSGKGAHRNNLLIQLFLENEKEQRQFYEICKLNEDDFLLKMDSFVQVKKVQYKQFKEASASESSNFDNLITNIIHFPIYKNKEEYPLFYKRHFNLKEIPKLSVTYYNHRKIINNNKPFKDYYTYENYLWSEIYNISFHQIEKDSLSELSSVLLNQINKLVKDEDLKNNMLKQTYVNSLFDSSCSDHNKEKTKQIFFNCCTDKDKKNEVDNILKVINTLQKNTLLPTFKLKNSHDKIINSNSLIGDPLVIYFWPKELNRIQNMAKRVRYLVRNHPKIRFIGIDGQLNNYNWKAYTKANDLFAKNQFQLVNQTQNKYYSNDYPRALVIDKEGVIKSNFTFISHNNFERILKQIEK